jgi:hypothetical protein
MRALAEETRQDAMAGMTEPEQEYMIDQLNIIRRNLSERETAERNEARVQRHG